MPVTLFLQPRASGDITLPNLNLPWYDAARGQVAGAALAGPALTVFDPRWQHAGWAVRPVCDSPGERHR